MTSISGFTDCVKMSTNKCPNCNAAIKAGTSTQCDGCHADVHLSCVGMNLDDIRITRNKSKSVKILCSQCNKYMGEIGVIKGLISSIKDEFVKRFTSIEDRLERIPLIDVDEMKTSIQNLQKKVDGIKIPDSVTSSSINDYEDLIQEVSEREKRKKNLMLFNVSEQNHSSADERNAADREIVNSILRSANIPDSEFKIIRLGKYGVSNNRPLKIIFKNEGNVHAVIKKAKDIRREKNISVSYDRTPKQIEYFRRLKESMNERIGNGETNLCIKYVDGRPKITHLN